MRDMVLKNQVLLGDSERAGRMPSHPLCGTWIASGGAGLDAVQTLIAGRYPPERAAELDPGQTDRHQDRDHFLIHVLNWPEIVTRSRKGTDFRGSST